ncbi:hypothetical protein V6N12_067028 [Hibiscus sabdariffa]|uniref:Uncharacterized protein n=1 Tax=Hibiscus sabdariffa TaxID=183260 RepID=A0ABR2BKQ9_9ROSI
MQSFSQQLDTNGNLGTIPDSDDLAATLPDEINPSSTLQPSVPVVMTKPRGSQVSMEQMLLLWIWASEDSTLVRSRNLQLFMLRAVAKEGNKVADQMTKLAPPDSLEVELFTVPPLVVGRLLHADVGD